MLFKSQQKSGSWFPIKFLRNTNQVVVIQKCQSGNYVNFEILRTVHKPVSQPGSVEYPKPGVLTIMRIMGGCTNSHAYGKLSSANRCKEHCQRHYIFFPN